MYDQKKALGPWLNRVISNQIKNLIRNNYGNYVRPCVKCAAAEGEGLCTIYGKQSGDCPLYRNWQVNKKGAYDTKLPVSLENHSQEVYSLHNSIPFNIEKKADDLHKLMKGVLKANEWLAYEHLYIFNRSEEETAKMMGYKSNEKNRAPGYKQIKNLKKSIMIKVKAVLDKGLIDLI